MRKLYSAEAEQSVLGAMMIDPQCIDDLSGLLTPASFHVDAHAQLFAILVDLREKRIPGDAITVAERNPDLDMGWLIDLTQNTPSAANVMAYAGILKDRQADRDLYFCAQQIQALVMDDEKTTAERLAKSQAIFTGLASETKSDTQASLKAFMRRYVDQLEQRYDNPDSIGVKTGYACIDKRLMALEAGSLYIVAARPAMGKTTYAMGIAKHVAMTRGKVMIFSLEMPGEQLAARWIASQGSVPLGKLRDASALGDAELAGRIGASAPVLMDLPIEIDDQASLSIADFRARARREFRKGRIELIVLDHINIAKGDPTARSRNDEIGTISGGLKALAKEFACPVIALSQLNRKCEDRNDKRPNNADLRDSGNIEQDADVIQFLYRDEVYHDDTPNPGIAEIITTKFRDGETGKDFMRFEGQYNRFVDVDQSQFVSQQEAYQPKPTYQYGRK